MPELVSIGKAAHLQSSHSFSQALDAFVQKTSVFSLDFVSFAQTLDCTHGTACRQDCPSSVITSRELLGIALPALTRRIGRTRKPFYAFVRTHHLAKYGMQLFLYTSEQPTARFCTSRQKKLQIDRNLGW